MCYQLPSVYQSISIIILLHNTIKHHLGLGNFKICLQILDDIPIDIVDINKRMHAGQKPQIDLDSRTIHFKRSVIEDFACSSKP